MNKWVGESSKRMAPALHKATPLYMALALFATASRRTRTVPFQIRDLPTFFTCAPRSALSVEQLEAPR